MSRMFIGSPLEVHWNPAELMGSVKYSDREFLEVSILVWWHDVCTQRWESIFKHALICHVVCVPELRQAKAK